MNTFQDFTAGVNLIWKLHLGSLFCEACYAAEYYLFRRPFSCSMPFQRVQTLSEGFAEGVPFDVAHDGSLEAMELAARRELTRLVLCRGRRINAFFCCRTRFEATKSARSRIVPLYVPQPEPEPKEIPLIV